MQASYDVVGGVSSDELEAGAEASAVVSCHFDLQLVRIAISPARHCNSAIMDAARAYHAEYWTLKWACTGQS